MGKELVADIKKQAGAIDAERRTIRDRLDALKDEVRSPLTAWETAEADRISGHEGAIVAIIEAARQAGGKSAGLLRELITIVCGYAEREWQEFRERADAAVAESLDRLNEALHAAEQYERDQAELAELRRLKAEREAADHAAAVAKAQAEREAKAKAEAAELERERAEQAERWKKEAEERAAKQVEEAAARAIEQERQRVAAAKAAEEAAERKRQDNKRHREKVHKKIADAVAAIIGEHSDAAGPAATEAAEAIIGAIGGGNIPHVSINY